ncbi:hypothetical protein A8H39_00250 [Paraburkholderia fungorum]|uniref:hypothetical protein n=1 Tax=Paraburkholderia fungorum TaxID=134537 RepID=UPI000485B109|nr:hypothetical protein [Paraburkholderia fungorum]PNE59614.1 hypothetical protein A8H39_00250 [Paraburkholderia fungorum]
MLRFSFLTFVLMYFCGSFFRTSIEDMLLHEVLHSFLPSVHHAEHPYYDGREDRPERTLTRGCADGKVCHQDGDRQHEIRRPLNTDDFGDNGPLNHRYTDPT